VFLFITKCFLVRLCNNHGIRCSSFGSHVPANGAPACYLQSNIFIKEQYRSEAAPSDGTGSLLLWSNPIFFVKSVSPQQARTSTLGPDLLSQRVASVIMCNTSVSTQLHSSTISPSQDYCERLADHLKATYENVLLQQRMSNVYTKGNLLFDLTEGGEKSIHCLSEDLLASFPTCFALRIIWRLCNHRTPRLCHGFGPLGAVFGIEENVLPLNMSASYNLQATPPDVFEYPSNVTRVLSVSRVLAYPSLKRLEQSAFLVTPSTLVSLLRRIAPTLETLNLHDSGMLRGDGWPHVLEAIGKLFARRSLTLSLSLTLPFDYYLEVIIHFGLSTDNIENGEWAHGTRGERLMAIERFVTLPAEELHVPNSVNALMP